MRALNLATGDQKENDLKPPSCDLGAETGLVACQAQEAMAVAHSSCLKGSMATQSNDPLNA